MPTTGSGRQFVDPYGNVVYESEIEKPGTTGYLFAAGEAPQTGRYVIDRGAYELPAETSRNTWETEVAKARANADSIDPTRAQYRDAFQMEGSQMSDAKRELELASRRRQEFYGAQAANAADAQLIAAGGIAKYGEQQAALSGDVGAAAALQRQAGAYQLGQAGEAARAANVQSALFGEQRGQQGIFTDAAMGRAPSVAAIQMQEGLDAASRAQMSAAAGSRDPAAQYRAQLGMAELQRGAIRDTAMLRAQEMAAARGQLISEQQAMQYGAGAATQGQIGAANAYGGAGQTFGGSGQTTIGQGSLFAGAGQTQALGASATGQAAGSMLGVQSGQGQVTAQDLARSGQQISVKEANLGARQQTGMANLQSQNTARSANDQLELGRLGARSEEERIALEGVRGSAEERAAAARLRAQGEEAQARTTLTQQGLEMQGWEAQQKAEAERYKSTMDFVGSTGGMLAGAMLL